MLQQPCAGLLYLSDIHFCIVLIKCSYQYCTRYNQAVVKKQILFELSESAFVFSELVVNHDQTISKSQCSRLTVNTFAQFFYGFIDIQNFILDNFIVNVFLCNKNF